MSPLRALLPIAPALGGVAVAQQAYTEVAAERGFLEYSMADGLSAGLAAADYDGDGDVDVFVPTAFGQPDRLYANRGDGHFDEVGAAAGVASTANHRAGLWLDVEGDGDLDLVVAGDSWGEETPDTGVSSLRLYLQAADGTFVDATAWSGLAGDRAILEDTHVGGLCAGDVDGDCDLDLYVAYWEGENALFESRGDGTFVDVSAVAGFGDIASRWQPVLLDVDVDGDLDLYQAVDFLPDELWLNQGDGTFVDGATAAGVDSAWNEMGVAVGDYDLDGDFDLYVTNQFLHGHHNLLWRNETTAAGPAFTDVSVAAGVYNGGCGWGATFLDGAHAGRLDIATTNGGGGACALDRSKYFASDGGADPTFTEVGQAVGYWDYCYGGGLVALDADRDGDLDLLQTCNWDRPLLLFDCALTGAPTAQGWLVVRPRMRGPNTHAIGAVVVAEAAGVEQRRLVTAGTSCMSQEPAEAHFGLAAEPGARVRVEWPDGRVSDHGWLPAGSVVTLRPPAERRCGDALPAPTPGATPAPSTPSPASGGAGQAGG